MEDLAYHMCSEFDELVKQCMSEWKVPGLAIAIVAGDDIEVKVSLPCGDYSLISKVLHRYLQMLG